MLAVRSEHRVTQPAAGGDSSVLLRNGADESLAVSGSVRLFVHWWRCDACRVTRDDRGDLVRWTAGHSAGPTVSGETISQESEPVRQEVTQSVTIQSLFSLPGLPFN